ncbi:MAG: amidohydrolase family protein, partial [Acidobacteriota bacterium]
RSALPALARLGRPLFAHPERVPRGGAEATDDDDPRSYAVYRASRPSRFEVEGVELLVRLARDTGCAVHIGPLASRHALGAVRAARGEGLPVSVDTAPHYLGFAAELIGDGETLHKVAPPIRGEEHREGLWQSLSEGTIDMIASSHTPVPPALREGDFQRAFPGIASLQWVLPATWTEALSRGFGPVDIGRWLCRTPARRLGLDGRKGRLAAGYDADLVVWDPEAMFEVDDSTWEHRHPGTPWNGRTLFGVVERTYVRGHRAFDRWSGVGEALGRIVRRGEDVSADA